MAAPTGNWSCAGVCGVKPWLGQNLTVCCVESCKYPPEFQPYNATTPMLVFSCSCQHLQHVVGPVGLRPGRSFGGPPPYPGLPARAEGPGQPLPGRLQAQTSLAGLLLLEEG